MTLFTEAKSRVITPAQSIFDFQVGNTLLIKNGQNVVSKLVKDFQEPDTLVVSDPDGAGVQTITLNPDAPAKDADGEFKYWIDEGVKMPVKSILGEVDDLTDLDTDLDDDFPPNPDDVEVALDVDDDDDFMEDLSEFLREDDSQMTSQIPDKTVGGGVANDHDDEDGEGIEKTPPPADTTGIQSPQTVQQVAGKPSSNTAGSSPTNAVSSSSGQSSESVQEDVDSALSLVARGADPTMLASRLLRGATSR